MKQVLQSLRTGGTEVLEVPGPGPKAGNLLIRSRVTLVSAGTERMLISFGKAGWISKARQQPEKVRQVWEKLKTDGLLPTLDAVRSKLDRCIPMGYCHVGHVLETGAGVTGFRAGERVVSNGHHAELVSVPKNLCARIPDNVSDDHASFTVLGAIALQGIRLAEPTLGETFAVVGLGLVGLMAVQLLQANGCRVIGLDFNPQRLNLARSFGAETIDLGRVEDPVAAANSLTRGRGVDGVLITTATASNDPARQSAQMCRKRGRIILVGVAGLELQRSDFYEKELSFQVSCSYGPGRYDASYEQQGRDYPLPYVRWTEQRNFEAVLDMLSARRLKVAPLITHRFPLERAGDAYGILLSREPSLGVLLKYPAVKDRSNEQLRQRTIEKPAIIAGTSNPPAPKRSLLRRAGGAVLKLTGRTKSPTIDANSPRLGVIGAGNFATRVLIPAFHQAGVRNVAIASEAGLSAVDPARRYGFDQVTSDVDHVLNHPAIDTVVIATRHDSHAELTCRALKAGKNVFVEKPLAIDERQLKQLEAARDELLGNGKTPRVMVGFNRRFAPQIQTMQRLLATRPEPKSFVMTVNAGAIPGDHWTQSPTLGGGRMIGEGCHFVDVLRGLAGSPIVQVQASGLRTHGSIGHGDTMTVTLDFADGSIGTIHYFANGHRGFPKERLEAFCGERVLQLDNFRTLRGYGWPHFSKQNLWRQDKGHHQGVAAFVEAIRTNADSPIPWEELVEVTRATFAVRKCCESGERMTFKPASPIVEQPVTQLRAKIAA